MGAIRFRIDRLSEFSLGSPQKKISNPIIIKKDGGMSMKAPIAPFALMNKLCRRLAFNQGFGCIAVCLLFLLVIACGDKEMPTDFQENQTTGYKIAEITDGYRSIDDAYDNIDSGGVNTRLRDAIDNTESDFEISSYGFADVINDRARPIQDLLRTDLTHIVSQLVDRSPQHHEKIGVESMFEGDGNQTQENFYLFLDKVDSDGLDLPDDYISGLMDKIINYIVDEVPTGDQSQLDKGWLNRKLEKLIIYLQDPKFRDDFTDITKLATKLLIQTDYPMWVDDSGNLLNYEDIDTSSDTNLHMGNAVQGTRDLIAWLNPIVQNPETRELVHEMLLNAGSILDPSPEGELALKLRTLIENIESHFTIGGAVYEADPTYSEDSTERYSDAELGQLVREASPLLQQLVVRSDRPQAIIKKDEDPVYPLDLMAENLRSIGFDPDTIDVERSISDLLTYDIWGRDRRTDPEAWPTSFLENLLFLTQATANHGWQDRGIMGPNPPPPFQDSRIDHPQGNYVEELTLNDSLFSIRTIRTTGQFGVYEMAFSSTNGNHLYRTRTSFTLSQVDGLNDGNATLVSDDIDYRFFYDQNYGVLQFLAGPGAGDLGTPDGGNPHGDSLGLNEYHAYAPNGLHETQLAAWTMGWGVRACFNGEGPYFYADPNAEVVMVDGTAYRRYLRPNGKIYALVSDDGQYLYPVDEGDVPDQDPATPLINGQPQRDNRYKSQWHSDYYISHFSHDTLQGRPPVVVSSVDHFFTIDNSSGKTEIIEISDPNEQAGTLTYNELIPEDYPDRACSSPEEAFFRNFQWVMNEKKMVLIIPMYMDNGAGLKAAVFEIQECNGYSGLANLRRFRANHVWAKQGSDGLSTIPGDYRFEVVSAPDETLEEEMGAEAIYTKNIDGGTATPAIIGHNLPALYRLAFPHSTDPLGTFEDKVLGSREFIVGDANWENRNAVVPILFSLLSGLREYTPAYDPNNKPGINAGMRTFLSQTAIWIKPLFYFNRADQGEDDQKAPYNSYIPRVYGIYDLNGDGSDDRPVDPLLYVHQGAPFLTSAADFHAVWDPEISDFVGIPPYYYGDTAEERFYQPAPVKSLLNVLIDSDLSNPQTRCDGVLPLVTNTRTLTNFFKLILDPSLTAPPLEQIFTAMKFTKGPLTEINESAASNKGMDYPDWMFALGARDDDISLDEILDFIIGQDAFDANGDGSFDEDEEGGGLAAYPDCRVENTGDPLPDPLPDICIPYNFEKYKYRSWEEFNDTIDTVADLLHQDSYYSITQNLLWVGDRIFARNELYTNEEITGTLYCLGKLFGHYDTGTGSWVYQGQEGSGFEDTYNMLVQRVPDMNAAVIQSEMDPLTAEASGGASAGYYGFGDHYYSQLVFLSKLTGSDDLVEFLLNTVTVPQRWGTVLEDLDDFLANSPDIHNRYSELWPTLVQLLRDMARAVGRTQHSVSVNDVITDYGFQVN